MALSDYIKALRAGEKQYRQDLSQSTSPYPLVLEENLRHVREEGRVPLGQFEIPLSMITGTVSAERARDFASDFMPLLQPETEFAVKWAALYDNVQEVGVTEPITVYEFLQRFYVQEGNKRVSVSKFNGAVSIEANVTRIIPHESDNPESKIYTEFMAFWRITRIYEIEMSEPGGFPRLLRVYGEPPAGEERTYVWSDELKQNVRFLYSVFAECYRSRGGSRLPITTGDAFLRFSEIYGAAGLFGLSSQEIAARVVRVWDEFRVVADVQPTARILHPTEISQRPSLTHLLPLPGTQTLRIAFLYPRDPDESGWTYNHEIGRLTLGDAFSKRVVTKPIVCTADAAEETIEALIADGFRVIFTTSPVYHAVSMRMAVAHPEVILLNCSMNPAYKQLRTYYVRIYEAKFITGMIAGSMTETERIGYLADYPIYGTPASVSAFALGVKMVNPRAMVFLDWSTLKDHSHADYFREKQVDIISDRDINPPDGGQNYGLVGLYGGRAFRLAAPLWNWGRLYEDLVRSVLIGAWKNDSNVNQTHALNYYWGMSSGAIGTALSDNLPSGTRRLARLVEEQIAAGKFNPFTGIIFAQNGRCIAERDQELDVEDIIRADWLPDNVFGRIPAAEELREEVQEFVRWNSVLGKEQTP